MPIKLSKTNSLKAERSIETNYKYSKVFSPMQTSNHMRALKTQKHPNPCHSSSWSSILGLQPKALMLNLNKCKIHNQVSNLQIFLHSNQNPKLIFQFKQKPTTSHHSTKTAHVLTIDVYSKILYINNGLFCSLFSILRKHTQWSTK